MLVETNINEIHFIKNDKMERLDTTATIDTNHVRNQLLSSLSLKPSFEWLDACIAYLQGKRLTANADNILFQVLYSDLRDVVREGPSAARRENSSTFPPARQLREGITHSSQMKHTYKHTLSNSFMLLCQLEELLDASMNTEKRLESNDSNEHNSGKQKYNRSGNHQKPRPSRCLKLCLSDGYDCNGVNTIIGIETTAIPNLFVDSLAGLKLLLKGPIIIRHKVLLLNQANCIIIGGCIEDLVRNQSEALMKAKRLAGVGVDATIRALIGTTGLDDGVGADDEAHEESGDFVSNQQQHHQLPPAHRVALPTQPPLRERQQQSQPPSSLSIHNNNNNNSLCASSKPISSLINLTSSSISTACTRTSSINPYNRIGRNTTSSMTVNSNDHTSNDTGSRRVNVALNRVNPYSRPQQQEKSSIRTTQATNTRNSQPSITQNPITKISNPHNRLKQNDCNSTGFLSSVANSFEGVDGAIATAMIHTSTARVTPSPINNITTSEPCAFVSNMPFDTLHQLLLQVVNNKEMYESQRNMTFRVKIAALTTGTSTSHFDIVKSKKNGKSKKNKSYEFFLSSIFRSAHTSDCAGNSHDNGNSNLSLSCRIHPSLLGAYFDPSPHELRAVSRSNRAECTRITAEASQKIVEAYFSPRYWRATLNPTIDDFFGEGSSMLSKTVTNRLIDKKVPILILRSDH